MRRVLAKATIAVTLLCCASLHAQTEHPMPPDYRGVSTHVSGIFVTPVANAPFSAEVQIVSHQNLVGGGERVLTTKDHIARASSGRIRNEAHHLVSPDFRGEPVLRSVHIYDPGTRQNIFLDPATHLARESTLRQALQTPARAMPPAQMPREPGTTITELGGQDFAGLQLQGTRKTRTIPAEMSGTGKPVVVTDEYWYSPDLSIYMIIKHDDPRTGEQLVAVTKVERTEPPAEMLAVPSDYKVVDENPPDIEHTPGSARSTNNSH